MARKSKYDLEREIADLKSQLKAVRNEMAVMEESEFSRFIPFGGRIDIWGHSFERNIRDAISNQYDGKDGWIVIDLGNDHPFPHVLANVSYTEEDGTFASEFYRLARQVRKYDYDKNEWGEWETK